MVNFNEERRTLDNFEIHEDPVIREIQAIREEIAQITNGFSDEELVAWYKSEAQEALSLATSRQDIEPN